jgi:hypothetical protein
MIRARRDVVAQRAMAFAHRDDDRVPSIAVWIRLT